MSSKSIRWVVLGMSLSCQAQMSDPTRPNMYLLKSSSSTLEVKHGKWNLTLIVSTGRHRQAVINGTTVKVGSSLGGVEVIKITDNEIAAGIKKGEFEIEQ